MIVFFSALGFALYGGRLAKARGGKRPDIAQYAVSYALFGGIIGMAVTIAIDRMI